MVGQPVERMRAFTVFGLLGGISSALGPVIGGVMVDADPGGLGRRSIFPINLPVGLLAVVGALRLLPADPPQPDAPPGLWRHCRWLEGQGGRPIVQPALLQDRGYRLGPALSLLCTGLVPSWLFVLTFAWQIGAGLSATRMSLRARRSRSARCSA